MEEWSHGELLSHAARLGLWRLVEFIGRDPNGAMEPWEQRLVLQASESVFAHVHVSQLRHAEEQLDWATYMKKLEREERTLEIGPESEAPMVKRAKRRFFASPEVIQTSERVSGEPCALSQDIIRDRPPQYGTRWWVSVWVGGTMC